MKYMAPAVLVLMFLSILVLAILYPNGGEEIVSEKSYTTYTKEGVRVDTVFTEKNGISFSVWKLVDGSGRIIKYGNSDE